MRSNTYSNGSEVNSYGYFISTINENGFMYFPVYELTGKSEIGFNLIDPTSVQGLRKISHIHVECNIYTDEQTQFNSFAAVIYKDQEKVQYPYHVVLNDAQINEDDATWANWPESFNNNIIATSLIPANCLKRFNHYGSEEPADNSESQAFKVVIDKNVNVSLTAGDIIKLCFHNIVPIGVYTKGDNPTVVNRDMTVYVHYISNVRISYS